MQYITAQHAREPLSPMPAPPDKLGVQVTWLTMEYRPVLVSSLGVRVRRRHMHMPAHEYVCQNRQPGMTPAAVLAPCSTWTDDSRPSDEYSVTCASLPMNVPATRKRCQAQRARTRVRVDVHKVVVDGPGRRGLGDGDGLRARPCHHLSA